MNIQPFIEEAIANFIPDKDNYVVGYADLQDLIKDKYPYRYATVIGRKLDDSVIDSIAGGPTLEYFNLFESVNKELSRIVAQISSEMNARGIDNRPMIATGDDSNRDANYEVNLRYKFSHKMAATGAGLGWIGKTDLLISNKFGPRVRFASVLTNHRFQKIGEPIRKSKCGSCTICVEKCPAQAASGRLWDTTVHRDEFYDAHKCRDMCKHLAMTRIQKDATICGICVSVCPFGKKKRRDGPTAR
ncbi:MAG: 4Fe-4S double cluster binding domain-containing protein [Dehalococcoidia bacterium]